MEIIEREFDKIDLIGLTENEFCLIAHLLDRSNQADKRKDKNTIGEKIWKKMLFFIENTL
jgi:hypothetical protein